MCDSRVVVPVNTGVAVTGTNVLAGMEQGEPNPLGVARRSVWYAWTAELAGRYLVTLAGSDIDTVLSVYTSAAALADLAEVSFCAVTLSVQPRWARALLGSAPPLFPCSLVRLLS